MIKVKNYLIDTYRYVTDSIAFYPSMISLFFFLTAVVAIKLRDIGVTDRLLDIAPYLVLSDADTSRTILSTLIGGLLSLVVFSFSMVMLLLSQASSNFSPRLLPGLISEKKHQIVLGMYLGTIVYCILILINISPNASKYQLPGFAILLGIIFGILCIGMFVYFIHSISQEIQISSILVNVYDKAKKRLLYQGEKEERSGVSSFPEFKNCYEVKSQSSGYFQGVNEKTLLEIAKNNDSRIKILPVKGMFILHGITVAYTEKKLDEEAQNQLLSCLQFNRNERVEENYILGFKQITEIAVKAMSPGINDPATAISTLDYLSELFALRMKLNDEEYLTNQAGELCVEFKVIKFKYLLYNVLAPLRQYAKHDVLVMQKVLVMLRHLLQQPAEKESYYEDIKESMDLIFTDVKEELSNEKDLQMLKKLIP